MEFLVSKENFYNSLQKVINIITNRSTLQILSNVLIENEEGNLKLTTTDLDIRIQTQINCESIKSGKTTVTAKKLFEIIKMMPDDKIQFLLSDGNHIEIKCGNSKIKLNGLQSDDFPQIKENNILRRFEINQNDLGKMIKLINYSVTQDDTRKALNGILFSIKENNLTTVATDGRRLALVEKMINDFNGNDGDSILPVKSANEIYRLMGKEGKVVIEIGEKIASFNIDDRTKITTKLIEENYPNYKQVIPISFTRKICIKRENFINSILRVRSVISERGYFVKMDIGQNKIDLSGNSAEIGESSDSFQIDYDGTETSISFNPDFLLEPLKEIDSDNVIMKLNDGYNPVALTTDDGFLYVIMPMRNR